VTREFATIGEDRYRLEIQAYGVALEVDRLHRDGSELHGELFVRCDLPGTKSIDGVLSVSNFNLSSSRSRRDMGKNLAERANKPTHRTSDARFEGVTDLFTVSDVYFSKNGRLALTALSSFCGGLCGQHQWKILEKLPTGEWQERPSWITCRTIATTLEERHETRSAGAF
jgi:hypothetical protein